MAYQLDWLQALEATFWADNIILMVLAVLSRFAILIMVYYALHKARQSKDTKILAVVLCLILIISVPLEEVGNGWYIEGDKFYMKAFRSSENINITSMEIGWVDFYSEWEPVTRINATGLSLLVVGKYRLKNGKVAFVFVHYPQKKVLLIHANQTYYMIGYPEVNKLHDELLKLGAKEKYFKSME